MDINKEMLEKAKTAKTVEEFIALAQENGIELSEEKATAYFEKLNAKSKELADEELENVVGGGCGDPEVDAKHWCEHFVCKDSGCLPEPSGSGAVCQWCRIAVSCDRCKHVIREETCTDIKWYCGR